MGVFKPDIFILLAGNHVVGSLLASLSRNALSLSWTIQSLSVRTRSFLSNHAASLSQYTLYTCHMSVSRCLSGTMHCVILARTDFAF